MFNGYKGSRVLEVDGVMLCNSVNVLNADETVHLGIVRTVNLRYFTVIKKNLGEYTVSSSIKKENKVNNLLIILKNYTQKRDRMN